MEKKGRENIKIKLALFWRKLNKKFRIVAIKESSFEEIMSFRLSPSNIINMLIGHSVLIAVIVFLLFAYSPLKRFMPHYLNSDQRKDYLENLEKTDSLRYAVAKQEQYIENLKIIINGGEIPDQSSNIGLDPEKSDLRYTKSQADSLNISEIEREEAINLTSLTNQGQSKWSYYFIPPVNGTVVDSFNVQKKHLAVDVVAEKDSPIKSIASGTVINSGWTYENGFVIMIQHDNNIISSYKHNHKLLKSVGDIVKAGEVIAVIGNTGEHTTGPHLHFELWENGKPVDPLKYIIF